MSSLLGFYNPNNDSKRNREKNREKKKKKHRSGNQAQNSRMTLLGTA